MAAIHTHVLDAAVRLADRAGHFRLRDIVHALPELNEGTVRTHVASRCCVNAPSHHQSRHPYFRALGRGVYALAPPFRKRAAGRRRAQGWQDRIIDRLESGVDRTLIEDSLKRTPTERLERMRSAAASLERMRRDA